MTVDFRHYNTATQRTKGAHLFLCNVQKMIIAIVHINMYMSSQPCELLLSYLMAMAENNKVHVSLFCGIITEK